MAEKTFNDVRLQLKYDTYTNWTTANPVLLAGEIALTTVPTKSNGIEQVPAVLMKVGDGTTAYNSLRFASALAANVHDWALGETKPTYSATEITGLADYISGEIQDSNTTYQIVKVDNYNYKLQYKELNGSWTDVAENGSIVIPEYDDSQLTADIEALQTQVGTGKVEEQISAAIAALNLSTTYDAKGAAATAETNAKAYTDTLANGTVASNTAAIAAIKDGETIDSFADVESEIEAAKTAASTAASTAETNAKAYTDALKTGDVAAAKTAAQAAQSDVDALESKVGNVTSGKTVVEMIEDAQTAATYDDTQVKADIAANTAAITANKTDIEGKLNTAKTDLQKSIDENASAIELLTNGVNAEKVDGVNDLIQYVEEHGTEVTGIKADITANAEAIDTLETKATSAETRLDAVEGDIDALQADTHTHTNKTLLDSYTQTEANLADAVAKKHSHANATVLDGISSEKVSNWDAAKTGVDALEAKVGTVASGKTLVEMIEDAEDAAIASATYDDTQVRGLIKTNSDAIDVVEGKVEALETNAVLSGDTLILNCGNSVIA